jgi:hypothetical protein
MRRSSVHFHTIEYGSVLVLVACVHGPDESTQGPTSGNRGVGIPFKNCTHFDVVAAEIVAVDLLAEFGWETQESGLGLVALSAAGGLVLGNLDAGLFWRAARTLCLGWPCWRRTRLASHCSVLIFGPFGCSLGSVSLFGGLRACSKYSIPTKTLDR